MRTLSVLLLLTTVPARCQTLPSFLWGVETDNSAGDNFAGLATDSLGNTYIAGTTTSKSFQVRNALQPQLKGYSNVFVTKLNPSGNIVYSTYFGGSGSDTASAMTVDAAGNVYVTGITSSLDFPTTTGTYSPTFPPRAGVATVNVYGSAFLFKLKADGSVAWSTYFASDQGPNSIAVDSTGSVYLAGATFGALPTTPGAYSNTYCCTPDPGFVPTFFIPYPDTFVTRFDPAASALIYSTYLGLRSGEENQAGVALAIAPDGSAYVGGPPGIYRFNATGSSLLASLSSVTPTALAIAADGTVYAGGMLGSEFQATPNAFQPRPLPIPSLPGQGGPYQTAAMARYDANLQNLLAGTNFYGPGGNILRSLALDAAGNVYIGGVTGAGLPTRTPLVIGFGSGYLSELTGDLSTLVFSGYFGADANFTVQGVAIGPNGSAILAGTDVQLPNYSTQPGNIWVNCLTLPAPPSLRIDTIQNAASILDGPVSPGETMLVKGAGFGADAQLLIDGTPVPAISITAASIAAVVPPNLQTQATVTVQSGGATTNPVLLPVAIASPGLFTSNGIGYGQGYILNQDGSVNTPANPTHPGDRITMFATGVGPVSFIGIYAVARFTPAAYIDGFYCDGVAASMGPVAGFPGDVYQLTVYVPHPQAMAAGNPNLANYSFPALSSLVLSIDGVRSQNGLAISIAN